MPRDGSGNYSLPSGNPVVTNTIISSGGWANPTLSDIATALTQSLSRDGQTTPTADLSMGNFKLRNLANALARTDAVNAGQIQDGGLVTLGSVSGTDTITASSSPAITAYVAGQRFQFPAAGANTTNAVTLNINGLGAKNVQKPANNGLVGLFPGDISAGSFVSVVYDGTQFQLQTQSASSIVGHNRLINGDFAVSQYNGASAVTPTATAYVIDRWQTAISQASKLTFQQIAAPSGFLNVSQALKITVASAFAASATDFFLFRQPIEGINVRDFQWGTANAKSVSLQIQVSASLTGTYSLLFQNYAQTRSYVATVTVTAANTPQLFTITIPGDSAGTWAAVGPTGFLYVGLDLGSGSNFNAASGSWGAGNAIRTAGSVSLVANAGASITVSGFQLEAGAPTTLEVLNYQQVLAMCQRYFQIASNYFSGSPTGAQGYVALMPLPVPMRVSPSAIAWTGLSAVGFPNTQGTLNWPTASLGLEGRTASSTVASGNFASLFSLSAEL